MPKKTKQLTPSETYNKVFKSFWSKGYISSLIKNKEGFKVFEFEGEKREWTDELVSVVKRINKKASIQEDLFNKKRVLVTFNK